VPYVSAGFGFCGRFGKDHSQTSKKKTKFPKKEIQTNGLEFGQQVGLGIF